MTTLQIVQSGGYLVEGRSEGRSEGRRELLVNSRTEKVRATDRRYVETLLSGARNASGHS